MFDSRASISGCAATKCDHCDGALLSSITYEGAKAYHPGCSPIARAKARLRDAQDRLIEGARKIGPNVLAKELAEYDAARAELRFSNL